MSHELTNHVVVQSLLAIDDYAQELTSVYDVSGYAVVRPVQPYIARDYVRFAHFFGEPIVNSRTDEHGIFEVGVGKTPFVTEDVNETRDAIKHTDGLTFVAHPDLSLLRCVNSDSTGKGHNRIYDAKNALVSLSQSSPDMFNALTEPVIELFDGVSHRPVLELSLNSDWGKLYFNDDNLPDRLIFQQIRQAIHDLPFDRVLLQPGDILMMNNARVLHGREAFQDETRHLQRIIVELQPDAPYRLLSGFPFEGEVLKTTNNTTQNSKASELSPAATG